LALTEKPRRVSKNNYETSHKHTTTMK